MQLTTVALLALVGTVLALPPNANQDLERSLTDSDMALLSPRSPSPCGDFMRKAVCCRRSILGIIDLGCHRAKPEIHTGLELAAACEARKKLPRCCIMGLLGIYGPCKPPYAVAKELGYFDNKTDHNVEFMAT